MHIRLSQNIHFCPLSQCKINEKKKIPECQQYYRGITHTGFAYPVRHTNYLYFKNPKFLTITFIFTFQMWLRYLPILEVKNLKYKEWSNSLENHAGSLQQSTETQFHSATSVKGEGDAQIHSLWTQSWGFCLFGVSLLLLFSLLPHKESSPGAKLYQFWWRICEFAAGNGKATGFWNVWL